MADGTRENTGLRRAMRRGNRRSGESCSDERRRKKRHAKEDGRLDTRVVDVREMWKNRTKMAKRFGGKRSRQRKLFDHFACTTIAEDVIVVQFRSVQDSRAARKLGIIFFHRLKYWVCARVK